MNARPVPSVVLHGPESTGKSTLAARLAAHFGTVWLPEYGRAYCETHGTDIGPDGLVAIMAGHLAARRALAPRACGVLIEDTDPLMTAAWSMMMFGSRNPALDRFTETGALYLLMDIDLPWIDDGLRLYPDHADQARFFALCRAELERRGVPWVLISGDGDTRFRDAVAAIERAGLAHGQTPREQEC